MTIAQPMLVFRRLVPGWRLLAFLALATLLGACQSSSKPPLPENLSSPYAGGNEIVIAVAPLRNESGVSILDELSISDTLVNEMQQTSGVSVLPINRTLAAMRALGLPQVDTPAQALALAKAAGADGVVVGTVTAWDPYDPPTLGLTLALFGRSPLLRAPADPSVDPRALSTARSEGQTSDRPLSIGALSVVSETLDASSGTTRELIRRYATGRHDPKSALGWKRYTASMGLYAKFACYEMSRRLFDAERARLQGLGAREIGTQNR